ncbi:endonuclease/exonuclease/phosphatase family protein [Rhodobacteraceae bacterium]|nr:endonuclease/exonuclease/phosphatase family protein [Paracoccaceae bacterium]
MADKLRIGVYDPALSRDGPGLLYRDLMRGDDAQLLAGLEVIAATAPDVLLLLGLDWDGQALALRAYQQALSGLGLDLPYTYHEQPNTGLPTGFDIDGDGRLGQPRDAQGYGRFTGHGGMALLSRYQITAGTDLSSVLWRDVPGALWAGANLPEGASQVQRLSSVAHWDVVVRIKGRDLHFLAWSATPPVFDGPEDRNGRRNHDEALFWQSYLDTTGLTDFVLLGRANLDPERGQGRRSAMRRLLQDARIQDMSPRSSGGALVGHPAATADYPADGAGPLRLDYILPAADITAYASGIVWPETALDGQKDPPRKAANSIHKMVWVDIAWP